MENPSLRDVECFMILLPDMYANELCTQKLPSEMAKAIGAYRKLELCLEDDQIQARCVVVVIPSLGGQMYLRRGWKKFTGALDLCDGYTLLLRYDGYSQINLKVFDLTGCRKKYKHADMVSCATLSLPIPEPRSFVVILKKYHLRAKYLAKNIPIDFEQAHGYGNMSMVILWMAGQYFVMGLKKNKMKNNVYRTSFWCGWNNFCAKNSLVVGDTCLFTAIRDYTWSVEADEMCETDSKGVLEATLKWRCAGRPTNGGGELDT